MNCFSSFDYHKHLGNVAGAEHFVDGGELLGFVGREVGREGAFLCASSSQELAGCTRRDRV